MKTFKHQRPNCFYGLIAEELRADKRIIVSLVLGTSGFALGHAAMALAAALVGRALVSGPGAPALLGYRSSSLLAFCYVGLVSAIVKSSSSILLAFTETRLATRIGSALRSAAARGWIATGLHDSEPRVLATIAVRIREVEGATANGVLTFVRAAAQLVPLAMALISLSPGLALGSALVLAPFAFALAAMRRRFRAASEQSQSLVEQLHAGTDELVKNLDVWRSYGKAEHVQRLIESVSDRASRAEARVQAARAGLSGANEVLAALALLGAIALSARLGFSMADGRLLAFAAVFFMAYRPLRDLGDARAVTARGTAAASALAPFLQRAQTSAPRPVSRRFVPGLLSVEDFGSERLGTRTSLRLAPREMVCLMGPTGSGKTTLLRALLGLETCVGKVCYAGLDLTRVGTGPWERPFAWVPQDAPLITGTLEENVTLFTARRGKTEELLASLGAEALVRRIGTDVIGPGGRPLSGGERRLVAIARALYTELPVVLLDEPTEGLDAHAAQALLAALTAAKGERALLIVTHRAEVARIADRIVRIGQRAPEAREPRLQSCLEAQN